MPAPSDPQLQGDTRHYLYAFEGDEALFVRMDRAAYRRSIFLDRRISLAGDGVVRRPVANLLAALQDPVPPAMILHVAHCGSTLLARALDTLDGPLVLREPLGLRQLGVEAANGAETADRLRLALALYGRRYGDGLTVVKANVPGNFLAPGLVAAGTPAILLHYPLRPYLLAILRSDNHRGWVRFVTTELRPGIEALAGSIDGLADAELAAALWLAQMRIFTRVLAERPEARSLSADMLFGEPAATITAAATLFGRTPDPEAIAATVNGPLFATYSKNPEFAFTEATRLALRAQTAATLAPELEQAMRWAGSRAAGLPDRLARPLVGEAPLLLD